jgi:integrase
VLRGPKLYPTVIHRYLGDVGFTGPTHKNTLSIARSLQRRVGHKRFEEITDGHVRDFIERDDGGNPRADWTRKRYTSALWQIFDWALDPQVAYVSANPVSRYRAIQSKRRQRPRPVRRKTWLSEERAKALVASAKGGDPRDQRDAFVLNFFLSTGLRVTEMLALCWRDVDFSAGGHGVVWVKGKGGKLAPVTLNKASHRLLFEWRSAYVLGYGSEDIGDLVVVPNLVAAPPPGGGDHRVVRIAWGRQITSPATLRKMVADRAQAAGIDHLRPHDLRRSRAGILKDRGADIEDIRKALRHSSVATTEIYLEDKPTAIEVAEDLDFG